MTALEKMLIDELGREEFFESFDAALADLWPVIELLVLHHIAALRGLLPF